MRRTAVLVLVGLGYAGLLFGVGLLGGVAAQAAVAAGVGGVALGALVNVTWRRI